MDENERRRSVRIPCENLIRYSVINENNEITNNFGYVHCKNISLIGMLFTTFEPLDVGTLLKIVFHIDLSENEFDDIHFLATVVRCDPKNADTFDIAVSITSLIEEKKKAVFLRWLANKDDEYNFGNSF